MAQRRNVRTQQQLQADSRTLKYEFEMFCGAASRLKHIDPNVDRIGYNAFVESFAIHCRALINFFFYIADRDSDVIAADFFNEGSRWNQMLKPDSWGLKEKTQADKQIAHITTDRRDLNIVVGKDAVWNISACVQELCETMDQFLKTVPTGSFDAQARQRLYDLIEDNARLAVTSTAGAGTRRHTPPALPGQYGTIHAEKPIFGDSLTGRTCP